MYLPRFNASCHSPDLAFVTTKRHVAVLLIIIVPRHEFRRCVSYSAMRMSGGNGGGGINMVEISGIAAYGGPLGSQVSLRSSTLLMSIQAYSHESDGRESDCHFTQGFI